MKDIPKVHVSSLFQSSLCQGPASPWLDSLPPFLLANDLKIVHLVLASAQGPVHTAVTMPVPERVAAQTDRSAHQASTAAPA